MPSNTNINADVRIKIVAGVILAIICVILVRLYFVQIVHGQDYAKRANAQYVSDSSLFDRGLIFFERRDGARVPAATVAGGYVLAIHPNLISDPDQTYSSISPIVELERSRFDDLVSDKDDPYDEVAHKLTEEEKEKIQAIGLDGVSVHREYWRFYPGSELAADVLGFVAYEEDELKGRYGLEKYYEKVLTRNNESSYVNFFAEIFSQIDNTFLSENAHETGDLVLTIEPTVQRILETTLAATKTEWSSSQTAGIIINPKTGEIYAMAETPSFDLNSFGNVPDISIYSNSLVESVYEMGSIIKALTVAAGLDADVINAHSTYEDTGKITLDGRTISNYDGRARGVVEMQEVLNQSLNTGAANIMLRLGTKKFGGYMKSFGLGEKTGIDLPNETAGLIGNLESPRKVEYATASFGQGMALTPIATARALSALGNGGTLITPHVVKRVEYEMGAIKEPELASEKRVISQESSEEITRMLVKVVDDALLGGTVALDNHSIAAKTGTAQIADSSSGGYFEDKFLHSFFGYFPAYDPEFLILLMNIEPKEARYASETLTKPFMDLAQFLIQYYEIPPDR